MSRANIYVWDGDGQPVGQFQSSSSALIALALSLDGQTLAAVGADRQVRLHNLADQLLIRAFPAHAGPIYNV